MDCEVICDSMFSFIFHDDDSFSQPLAPWVESYDKAASKLEYVVTQVFYPPYCPKLLDDSEDRDQALVDAVRVAAQAYHEHVDHAHKPIWSRIVRMLENLQTTTRSWKLNGDRVMSQLSSMQVGDVLAFPIHSQYTGVIFRKQRGSTRYEPLDVLRHFASSRTPERMTCPCLELAIDISDRVFDDKEFQTELANHLGCMTKAQPQSGDLFAEFERGHMTNTEYSPTLLTSILRGVGHPAEAHSVTKRIGNLIGPGSIPYDKHTLYPRWSRSPLWLLVRVALQSSLDRGSTVYKEFILFFLCNLANHAVHAIPPDHLLHAMSCKILRRLRKLGSSTPQWLTDTVLRTCTHLSDVLDGKWKAIQASRRSSVVWDHSHLIEDTRLVFPHCDAYISSSLDNYNTPHVHLTQSPSHRPRGTLSDFLSQEASFLEKAFDEDAYVALYDIEQAVQQGIDDWVTCTTDTQHACEQLRILSDAYQLRAEKLYTNPEHQSIMFLTLVELWVALDQLLLRRDRYRTLHAPTVSIDALEGLILHKTLDLHRLSRAHGYLFARHSQASQVHSLAENDPPVTGRSFEDYLKRGGYHSSYNLGDGPYEDSKLDIYIHGTTHTTNDVLSEQSRCHTDLTPAEFIAFGCLRSGGSLQWTNILRELRSRNLNFRRPEVYLLFAQASTHVGPLTCTGELLWHQELQDPSFCHALVNELESLFVDVGAGSSDGAAMAIISLLSRLLVSNSCEDVSEQAIRLLRNVREKTFDWVHELLYDTIDSPGDEKRNKSLCEMAAICRSTFDVDPTSVRKLLHSSQDIEVALSCAIIIHTVMFLESPDTSSYGKLLLERDRRLCFTLEQVLRDAIEADVSDAGIDLAIRKIWPGYRPGPHRWKPLRYPNSRWVACETAETKDRYSQKVSVDLLRGSVVVDGMPMGGRLSNAIKEDPTYSRVFGKLDLKLIPSDLPGMLLVTQFMMFNHHVHFTLRDGNLVIRAQYKDTNDILELIPHEQLKGDLPAVLIEGHAHWLNLSTLIIEIRPLETLWNSSEDNWKIRCEPGQYCAMKGHEFLVDFHGPAWKEISSHLECLDVAENLVITTPNLRFLVNGPIPETSSFQRISVALPRYGLSFFVNENMDLESYDFKDMVYDVNQCIGTLFGLTNKLVLRQKTPDEDDIIPRCILIPYGDPHARWNDGQPAVEVDFGLSPLQRVRYYIYKANQELGCLTGIANLASRLYLARLHALTSGAHRPDPLTGRTGLEEAISLVWSSGVARGSFVDPGFQDEQWLIPILEYYESPQMRRAIMTIPRDAVSKDEQEHWERLHMLKELRTRWSFQSPSYCRLQFSVWREAYLLPSEVSAQLPCGEVDELGLRVNDDQEAQGLSIIASAIYHRPRSFETHINDPRQWAEEVNHSTGIVESILAPDDSEALYSSIIDQINSVPVEPSSRRYELLFAIPTTVYRHVFRGSRFGHAIRDKGIRYDGFHEAIVFVLLALAQQPKVLLEDLSCYNGCDLRRGWYPSISALREYFSRAQHGLEEPDSVSEHTLVKQLLGSWPCEVLPMVSFDPSIYNVTQLIEELQEYTSSLCLNFQLLGSLLHATVSCGGPLRRFVPTSSVSLALGYGDPELFSHIHPHNPWEITLKRLLCERQAPRLPSRMRLSRCRPNSHGSVSPWDLGRLGQLLASLQTDGKGHRFQHKYISDLLASTKELRAHHETDASLSKPSTELLREHYTQCRNKYKESLDTIKQALGPRNDNYIDQCLSRSNQWPCITAYALFRFLASTSPNKPSEAWKRCLISLVLIALDVQRARRLLQFSVHNLDEDLSKELENEGCDGWDASEYPDWLLIQLQGNFLIRRAQAYIAKEMMSPQPSENTVLRVNMGEGKSSVIIPMCATALADGQKLARVIVPSALKPQMLQILTDRLAGLVNKRIYSLSFSRQTYQKFELQRLLRILSQCKDNRGVIVMQPEDVLSLKLTCLEAHLLKDKGGKLLLPTMQKRGGENKLAQWSMKLPNENSYAGAILERMRRWINIPPESPTASFELNDCRDELLQISHFLDAHIRDILDESDEILHPRFQLIYTLGRQQHVEGFPDRWTITQQILRLASTHISRLLTLSLPTIQGDFGPPGSFPYIYVLLDGTGKHLVSLIADDVAHGRLPNVSFHYLPEELRNAIIDFMCLKDIRPQTVKMVEDYAQRNTSLGPLLLLRGLLAEEILLYALTQRRWRVDYGLDRTRTMLAVPYRAKDVPAARAEFGHPDVTIVLTCLAYYYSGLTEDQLKIAFEILLEQDDPSHDYALWLANIDSVPASLRTLSKVNIRSLEQWNKYIVPFFTRNQAAIDYFLSKVVFPKHAKEFPWKISGSSWDITGKRNHLITGFSGTNDAHYLLPTSIVQHDPHDLHQRGASAEVLAHLLRPENNSYTVMRHEDGNRWTTHEFLQEIITFSPEIRVLLDVGAQILDLSGRQLAQAWLDLNRDPAGAIYFDEENELMVLARNGIVHSLRSSPLVQHLDRCVAYLDHAHTRGTDIKFPRGFQAAVTLGPKVTKDTLVQGCMRMRQLGRGHNVKFFAPPEVDRQIRSAFVRHTHGITVADILRWAMYETCSDIQRWAPYWVQQGMNHESQEAAWRRFCMGEVSAEQLTNAWLQPELKSLSNLYMPHNSPATLLTESELDRKICHRAEHFGVLSLPRDRMDEEQEREISRETERERVAQQRLKVTPANHTLHPDIRDFVKTGVMPSQFISTAFRPIFTTLTDSLTTNCDSLVWSPYILATADFCETIVEYPNIVQHGTNFEYETVVEQGSSPKRVDDYLRPVHWVLSGKWNGNDILVLISPFEADQLMPDIRVSDHVHLHVYTPRTRMHMKPCDDLMLYSIPPVPSDWTPPWALLDQLNVFAGQVHLRDYASYVRLCQSLGVYTKELPDSARLMIKRNKFHVPGSFDVETELEDTFDCPHLHLVKMLLAIKQRGRNFAESHMGRMLQGRPLREEDFPSWTQPTVEYHRVYGTLNPPLISPYLPYA